MQVASTRGSSLEELAANPAPASVDEGSGIKWNVFGPMPLGTPIFDGNEFEVRVTKCHKQRETPIYGCETTEDIEV
ncbi:uncharacterized protein PITG_02543 [Phytophthora infestans T30-4]|uniref:Uncharacterized protein n=1 Tax=Phytophthora infestans (strain T30-4) TaxID=403677 RepID=D0MWL1_PHYIT|nr:uncharacterized protein PITG_02543 [Phytophthora infestans T30-4]EEY64024.1 hypothetical protein PITG_02543 [Phytophthora infestans T30-4]|eukprot:XP_002907460.1 hypothetical protein PITG_02543 [Phytophthora infestans T30-4]